MQAPPLALAFMLVLAVPAGVRAAPGVAPYVFGGGAGASNLGGRSHVGGGVDFWLTGRAGVQAEGGWVGTDYGIGLVSFSGLVSLAPGNSRAAPFVTGGYSTSAFRGSAQSFLTVGFGVDVRAGRHAVRLELREHAGQTGHWRDRHIVSARVGFVWSR
jgi:hypothetical protein